MSVHGREMVETGREGTAAPHNPGILEGPMLGRILDKCDGSKSGPHEALVDISRGSALSKPTWKSKTPGAFKVPLNVEMPAGDIDSPNDDHGLSLMGVDENGNNFCCVLLHFFFKGKTIFVNDKGDAEFGKGAINMHGGQGSWEQM
jgi:hypothetical protein